MNKKAFALIFSTIVVMILVILGAATFSRSISENRIAQKQLESAQAFWAAEAGVNEILNSLRADYSLSGEQALVSLGADKGEYQATIVLNVPSSGDRTVTVYGYFPSKASCVIKREVKVVMNKAVPPGFYDNIVYSAGDVVLNGDAYSVSGDVYYAGELNDSTNITGTITHDPSINPLMRLDFESLLAQSQAQNTDSYPGSGNTYDVGSHDRKLVDPVTQKRKSLPTSFWYTTADDGIDNDNDGETDEEDEWVPNIVYINGDLKLNGDIGTVGGFFVVVGDVITFWDEIYDTTINGNGRVNGVIYTRGALVLNGGGGGGCGGGGGGDDDDDLNIYGGVWAGEGIRFNGGVNALYNADFMGAIRELDVIGIAQVVSWQDLQNPYNLN